jgi:prefoldin subunit 5
MRSFTVKEFHDFIVILEEKPEWREELRRLVLTDELLKLPEIVRELAEAQRRTEERLENLTVRVDALAEKLESLTARVDALTARVDALAEAQRRTEERLENLTARVDALAEKLESLTARVDALTARVDALAEAQRRTEEELRKLTARVNTLTRDVSELKGDSLERKYRERAFAYFSQLLRRAHTLSPDEIAELINQGVEEGIISDREGDELLWTDVIVRGRRKDSGEEVYLAVEVSWGVGVEDVERAASRAEILRKFGFNVLSVVAGREITPDAERLAVELGVYRVVDGRVMD